MFEKYFGTVEQDAYAELVKLAVERRARLEESRKLWQFYWDMADEENWIKEKEQILSTGDIGHDLTTIHLLISKHRSLEEDVRQPRTGPLCRRQCRRGAHSTRPFR